jgi:hypothetical protein
MPEFACRETFEDICARSGISEEFRGPEHMFFEKAPDGAMYAISNEIEIRRNPAVAQSIYELRKDGAAVSLEAEIAPISVCLGARTLVHASAVIINPANIAGNCEIIETPRLLALN